MVKLVALDIDGTIVPGRGDSNELPGERVRRAIAGLTDAGVHVVLASGRMFPGTQRIATCLGLRTPVICQQGCSVHLMDGTMLHEFPIEHRVALEVVAYARELGRAYEWFNPLRYLASVESEATRNYGRVSGIAPEYRADPERSGVRPTGVGVISNAEEASGIHRELVSRYADALHVLDFPEVTVAVAPDANKGHALSLLCADFGIDRHEVLAIGDSVNDAPMLAWAGRGIAMAHADRYALAAADEVLDGDEDAVAVLLEDLAIRRASLAG
jgi:Cof subfamily protein (haloacid dehalogenase superfamily)